MTANQTRDFEEEFEQRFAWRKSRQIENLKELYECVQSGGFEALRLLYLNYRNTDDPLDALQKSILDLWFEAAECYIFGLFQACTLACRGVTERCLKLEYQKRNSTSTHRWTLGKCIKETEQYIDATIIAHARQIQSLGDDRAHANLERSDPAMAALGGENRGIEILSSHHYLIEPFRGEAKQAMESTWIILRTLYSHLPVNYEIKIEPESTETKQPEK